MSSRLGLLVLWASLATGAAAASVGGDAVFGGGSVDIDEAVAGNLYTAGGRVTVNAPVAGKARIAGGAVIIKGSIEGSLKVAGGRVTLDGPVGGDVSVAAGKFELGPNARIAGNLRYRAGEFERDPQAQVTGTIVQSERHRAWGGHSFSHSVIRWAWTAGLVILAAIIAGALPGATLRMKDEMRTRPWLASLFGLVALICIPIAAVLAMVTIIGIPLGLLALIGYFALLIVGYVCASVVVGGLLLDRFKADAAALVAWRIGAAVLAMLVIAALGRIPFVGGFVALAALIVGIGAIVAAIVHHSPPQAATG